MARAPKKSVTIRLDGDVLKWLKGYGRGYQTRVNMLLRRAMTSSEQGGRLRRERLGCDSHASATLVDWQKSYTATVTDVSVLVTGL
jgi:hypothetical protein